MAKATCELRGCTRKIKDNKKASAGLNENLKNRYRIIALPINNSS
jgi:hypothetical protein